MKKTIDSAAEAAPKRKRGRPRKNPEPQASVAVVKRGRGRPPKAKPVDVAAPAPKRRGRPPKAVVSPPVVKKVAAVVAATPKRRGRPPKVASPAPAIAVVADKPRRGRPPKAKVIGAASVPAIQQEVPKRKRGRPPKSATTAVANQTQAPALVTKVASPPVPKVILNEEDAPGVPELLRDKMRGKEIRAGACECSCLVEGGDPTNQNDCIRLVYVEDEFPTVERNGATMQVKHDQLKEADIIVSEGGRFVIMTPPSHFSYTKGWN